MRGFLSTSKNFVISILPSHLSEELLDCSVWLFSIKKIILAFIFLLISSFIKMQSENMVCMISALGIIVIFLLFMCCQVFHYSMDI